MELNEKKYVEKTLKNYEEKSYTKLDELKNLDKLAKRRATVFSYVFGVIGTLILGLGMCMAMKIILSGEIFMILGIIIGLVGIAMISFNYSIYKKILNHDKAKYAEQIKKISNELLNN